MKMFMTAVSLSLPQAQKVVNDLYPEHLDGNGQNRNNRRNYIANLLIEMFILPVNRVVAYSRTNDANIYDFDNIDIKDSRLSILYEETQTPQHLVQIFLTSKSFGEFKYRLKKQLNYEWPVAHKLETV